MKPGGCDGLAVAHAIFDDLSELIGTRPVAVIYSGKGLQPLWTIAYGHRGGVIDVATVPRRSGKLVKATAKAHEANIDPVFDCRVCADHAH